MNEVYDENIVSITKGSSKAFDQTILEWAGKCDAEVNIGVPTDMDNGRDDSDDADKGSGEY